MSQRLRISHVVVQPVLVYDDGNELSPGPPASPQQVGLNDLGGLADKLRAEVDNLNAQATPDEP